MPRNPTAGEYILSFLGSAIPGYVKGKQDRETKDRQMTESDKFQLKLLGEAVKSENPDVANPAIDALAKIGIYYPKQTFQPGEVSKKQWEEDAAGRYEGYMAEEDEKKRELLRQKTESEIAENKAQTEYYEAGTTLREKTDPNAPTTKIEIGQELKEKEFLLKVYKEDADLVENEINSMIDNKGKLKRLYREKFINEQGREEFRDNPKALQRLEYLKQKRDEISRKRRALEGNEKQESEISKLAETINQNLKKYLESNATGE